jgi:raffinose/stachyose/melibiose transport system permease protein
VKKSKVFNEKNITKTIFLLPGVLIVFIFMFYPAISGFYLSLTDWNGVGDKIDFIGIRNFVEMFKDPVFVIAVKNTFKYCIITVIFQHAISLALAVIIDRGIKWATAYKAILFIPCLLSTIVTGMVFSLIFSPINGSFNFLLKAIGLKFLQNDWLGNPKLVLYVIIATSIWQYIGYSMVIYLAGLQTIPKDHIEAGNIDGTNAWQRFRYIEFPGIAPAFTINTVLSVIGSLKAFEIVYSMSGGGPANSSEVIATYVYSSGFTSGRMGYGTAVSLFLFVMVVIISLLQTKILGAREADL